MTALEIKLSERVNQPDTLNQMIYGALVWFLSNQGDERVARDAIKNDPGDEDEESPGDDEEDSKEGEAKKRSRDVQQTREVGSARREKRPPAKAKSQRTEKEGGK